jgi:prepilin-type processing-associated H-X9-DG protein
MKTFGKSAGVTVVELLVAIGIVALLAALLFPAVQAAREAARKTSCANNVRQLALGFALHEESQRFLPTGGWGWQWYGDPDRGFGELQPGGWPFGLLPFLEQKSLRALGKGAAPPLKRAEGRKLAEMPLELFYCPTRRRAEAYPFQSSDFINIDRPDNTARSDYAANAGDQKPGLYGAGPSSLAQGDSPTYAWPNQICTGVVFRRSAINSADVRDGRSSTYLVAEAYLDPMHYNTGSASNDDQGLYVGYDRDTLRVTHPDFPPLRDTPSCSSDHSFGSAHYSGFNAAFCDGSVRHISYGIDGETHRRLGNRHDRQPVDLSSL